MNTDKHGWNGFTRIKSAQSAFSAQSALLFVFDTAVSPQYPGKRPDRCARGEVCQAKKSLGAPVRSGLYHRLLRRYREKTTALTAQRWVVSAQRIRKFPSTPAETTQPTHYAPHTRRRPHTPSFPPTIRVILSFAVIRFTPP